MEGAMLFMPLENNLILDTDIGCDCDDAGALALLHSLAALEKTRILAMTHSNSSVNGVACMDAVNTYYGRPDIPLGCYRPVGFMDAPEYDTYATKVAEKFNNRYCNDRCVPEACKLIRQQLATQPEHSVTLVSIGQLTNFARLLLSHPDEISPLSGVELVRKHVKEMVVMGGEFAKQTEAEYNIVCDIGSTQTVVKFCPVPITFCGFEIGQPILTGQVFFENDDQANPVYWCYQFHGSTSRSSWDQATVLYAVLGAQDYWILSPWGTVSVTDRGVTTFAERETGMHRYLMPNASVETMSRVINALMFSPHGRDSGLPRAEESPHVILHQTDLFRPHEDPDDHWDVALEYALVHANHSRLASVLIDPPLKTRDVLPDTVSIDILNSITHRQVPYCLGGARDGGSPGEEAVVEILQRSKHPVSIQICGSCTDIAAIATRHRALFEEKCCGIYLNAGASHDREQMEYNVALDSEAFGQIFSLKCPIYWLPCFEKCEDFYTGKSGRHATFFRFREDSAFDNLSADMQKYFMFMYSELPAAAKETFFARSQAEIDGNVALRKGNIRNMWCTAGMLHAAGLTVLKDGSLSPLAENHPDSVFSFVPIAVTSVEKGIVSWEYRKDEKSNVFLFTKKSEESYARAMPKALIDTIGLIR